MAEVKGWDSLMQKIARLEGGQIEEVAKTAVLRTAQAHQHAAKKLAQFDSGELQHKISAEVKMEGGEAVGLTVAYSDHAAFVEFGTGPVGAASPKSGSPASATIQYALGPFSVKRGNFKKGETVMSFEDYWVYYDESRQQFFATRGQPAKPFMYPSALIVKDQAKNIQAEALREFLKTLGVK